MTPKAKLSPGPARPKLTAGSMYNPCASHDVIANRTLKLSACLSVAVPTVVAPVNTPDTAVLTASV